MRKPKVIWDSSSPVVLIGSVKSSLGLCRQAAVGRTPERNEVPSSCVGKRVNRLKFLCICVDFRCSLWEPYSDSTAIMLQPKQPAQRIPRHQQSPLRPIPTNPWSYLKSVRPFFQLVPQSGRHRSCIFVKQLELDLWKSFNSTR